MPTCSAHAVCVLRHNPAAVLFWLWAIKNHLGITLGITGRCWGKHVSVCNACVSFGSKLIDRSFWTRFTRTLPQEYEASFIMKYQSFTSHFMLCFTFLKIDILQNVRRSARSLGLFLNKSNIFFVRNFLKWCLILHSDKLKDLAHFTETISLSHFKKKK